MRAYTRAYADCRRSCLYFCRRLRPAHTRAYADCRRQSSNLLNFQGQRRPPQAFQPITKALQCHRGLTRCSDRDVCGRIPTHTLACLYFYPRRNLRYAVATHRQPQAWTSAPAAGAYARMEYKPGLSCVQLRATRGMRQRQRHYSLHTYFFVCVQLDATSDTSPATCRPRHLVSLHVAIGGATFSKSRDIVTSFALNIGL